MPDRILVTGPGGRIGPHLLPYFRKDFSLRLFDAKPLSGAPGDEIIQGDIRDFESIKKACAGVQAVVHLAAISDEDDFHTKLLPVNLNGTYNVFEAARQARVPKLIFASTCQTVLGYSEGTWVSPDMPARPSTVYACTKIFGEALGRYYADRQSLSVICLRIAWFQPYDSPALAARRELAPHWCSPGDLAQLIILSIKSTERFAIFFAVSNNAGRFWDISNAQRLVGFEPKDEIAQWVRQTAGKTG